MERGQSQVVDYGFGDAPYKRLFSTENWEERHYMLFGSRLRPAYVALSVKTIRGASTAVQNVVRRWGLEGRIKKLLRGQKTEAAGQEDDSAG